MLAYAVALQAPVLPIVTAPTDSWPIAGSAVCGGSGAYCGDIRAVVTLTAGDIVNDSASVQLWWRRRDAHPENKSVIVLGADGTGGFTVVAEIEGSCGALTLSRPKLSPGDYHIYFLPYFQSGGGAGLRFSWQGCSDKSDDPSNFCVRRRRLSGASVCATVTPAAASVVRLENRDDFNAFSDMELLATAGEVAETTAALVALSPAPVVGVFPEAADRSVRVLDLQAGVALPARWALGGAGPQPRSVPAFSGAAAPGQWLALQLGLWAYAGSIANVTLVASALVAPGGATIPATAITCINLGGIDISGAPFVNNAYGLAAGAVGSLWVGVAVPAAAALGAYAGTLTLSARGSGAPVTVALTVTVSGAPVPRGGADNIQSMARLAWLDSQLGLEDTVPPPYVPVGASGGAAGAPLVVTALRKVITLGDDGLPVSAAIAFDRVRRGAPTTTTHELLDSPVAFTLHGADGAALPARVTAPAALTAQTQSQLGWSAAWAVNAPGGATVDVALVGTLDFSSISTFAVTLTNGGAAAAALGDVRLTVPVSQALRGYIVGMSNSGANGAPYTDRQWRWVNHTGSNKVWVGRPEAGILVDLKGDGPAWDSPMFNIDYATIPFIPPTWGGVAAAEGAYGANITNGTVLAFSGPRTLAQGASVVFRFALAFTPSRAVDWTKHWATRTQQLGYDVPYSSPAANYAKGVSVVTLHQGTPGIVNGSLINPYINYPFLNDTVPLLTNFTAQANALGMATKFYYTVRELSSRAPEMFAWHAMQGEVVTDQDPWVIVQDGYAHDWNTHGGSAFLHQHMVSSYGACWQQSLSNGETDPSVCVRGVSRIFNYYLNGLDWSFSQPPYINGIYYDGISFTHDAMVRIRRVADAAAAAAGKGFPALLDLHTGRSGPPEICSYYSIYPLVDYVWDGEGYDFAGSPAYWLVEISAMLHGLTGDTLGSGEASVWRAMLFGMTQRDAVTSQALWRAWDATGIAQATAVFGWWDMDGPAAVNVSYSATAGAAGSAAGNCTWLHNTGGYYGSTNEQCLPPVGPTAGCWLSEDLADVQAACCADPACAGFSYGPAAHTGCCKAEVREFTADGNYDGYRKQGWVPPGEGPCVLATTWSAYASHTVIVLANFCGAPVNATLAVQWAEIGLDAATAVSSLPGIEGVQTAAALAGPEGPFALGTDGGIYLLISAHGVERQ